MEVISFRVPEKLRDEMRRLRIDWAEFLRKVTEEKVREERMKEACRVMDGVRMKTLGVKFDSVRVIREARESR